MPGHSLLNIGHGYSAARLAASLAAEGWRVAGTTRSPDKAAALAAEGVRGVLWDDEAAMGTALAEASHLLVSLPPDAEGDPFLRRYRSMLGQKEWVGYLSTTGVYGDRQGGWVDETGALAPVNARSRWRVAAESEWLALAGDGLPVQVFRLAGIYGPGRSAFDRLREGTAQRVVRPGQVFSRIHVDDIVRVLRASMERGQAGAVWNVADDEPAPPQDVIAFAAGLIGIAPPPEVAFEDADLSPMARSFYAESKRVDNRRLKQELGVRFAYPDYRAGLRAILAAGG
jgi:nucleoside-diphosphate-sugar epimerase